MTRESALQSAQMHRETSFTIASDLPRTSLVLGVLPSIRMARAKRRLLEMGPLMDFCGHAGSKNSNDVARLLLSAGKC